MFSRNLIISFVCLLLAAGASPTEDTLKLDECISVCEANTCEENGSHIMGTNQMLTCTNACYMRHIGASNSECLGHCDRHGGSGCFLKVKHVNFNLCEVVSGSSCFHGNHVSVSDCELGCNSYSEAESYSWVLLSTTLGCEPEGIVLNGHNRRNLQNCKDACERNPDCYAFNLMNGYYCQQLQHCDNGATKSPNGWFPTQNPTDIIQAWLWSDTPFIPSPAYFALVDAAPKSGAFRPEVVNPDPTEKLGEVQCCNTDGLCTRKNSNNVCISGNNDASKFTLQEAVNMCAALGETWSLCTRKQVADEICKSKGCQIDSEYTWVIENFNFQLKGLSGAEIVVITDGQETRQRRLSTSWQTFRASNANIVIRFTNDYGGRNRDVFFRSNTYTNIRSDERFAQWKCDTSSPLRSDYCERVRSGDFGWTTDYQIEFKKAAHWKTCRWQSTKDRFVDDRKHLVGWTCADNEILTGFGIKAGEDDVSKIQCCELGGHSSVIPETCTLLEAGMNGFDQHELASCNANDHMVFSGAYDASTLADDDFTEVLVGKCCEVKCDAPWCRNKDWGVNTDPDHCHTIVADGDKTKAQDLVCPEGTLVTEIRDGHTKRAHGIQRIESVVCCEMDLVSQPTIAPSRAPSTTKPTPSPTSAPTTSPTKSPTPSPTNPPSPSPTTAPSPSPTTAPSVAPTSTTDCLLALFRGLPHLSDAEILQGMDDCLPNCVVPQLYDYHRRALEGRLLSENAQ